MRDGQNYDFPTPKVKYNAPVSNPQAHRDVAFEPFDLVSKYQRVDGELIESSLDASPHH
jgi:hypothetical protein